MMSEMQRHLEANDKEERRHATAGEVEMIRHEANYASHEEKILEHEIITLKAARAKYLLIIIGALVTALALGALIYNQVVTARNERETDRKIEELTRELEIERQENLDLERCRGKFDTLIRLSNYNSQAALDNLVVVIATVPPNTPERITKAQEAIELLAQRRSEYNNAVTLLAAWNADLNDLPCPI